mgnify:CR=1 FL=1
MEEIITTDFAKFGYRERKMAEDLLHAWNEDGLPEDFNNDEVVIMMNKNSGNVFLTNSEFQAAMMNGKKIETFYNCGQCGNEGFKEDVTKDGTHCTECNELVIY